MPLLCHVSVLKGRDVILCLWMVYTQRYIDVLVSFQSRCLELSAPTGAVGMLSAAGL